jgi:pimeloyl-ACP methyl ester carboxylesterase
MAIKEIYYGGNSFIINYNILNQSSTRDILFLHGWGSDQKVSMSGFSNTLESFRHIYVDMPGFGKSKNDQVLTTYDYYKIMVEFLKSIGSRVDIIVGHSFGGKVATLLNPKLLVLLSSAGIVPQKSFKVRFKIKLFKLFKSIGLGSLYSVFASNDVKGMSSNMYQTFKNVVDEVFNEEFKKYSGKALIFWGKDDKDTPISSAYKIDSLIADSKLYKLDGEHYFFLDRDNADFIAKKISVSS